MTEHRVTLPLPTADEVRAARKRAGLTQEQAALLVTRTTPNAYRMWQGYEVVAGPGKREMPAAAWELFLLLTDQHPGWRLTERK